jgi:hypothetical protein
VLDQKQDQKIAAFGSSYPVLRIDINPVGAAEGCDLFKNWNAKHLLSYKPSGFSLLIRLI